MPATIVDWAALGQAAYVSAAIGLGVLLVAAIGVASSLKAQDDRAAGAGGGAVAFAGITALCVVALIGSIVAGIYLIAK